MATIAELEAVASTERCSIAAAPGVLVARFWEEASLPEVQAFQAGVDVARRKETLGMLLVIEEDCKTPDKATRHEIGSILAGVGEQTLGFAGVIMGSGLAATSKRTIMRLILSIARIRGDTYVCNEGEDGASWLARLLSDAHQVPYSPAVLLRGIDLTQRGS